ncbi:MAG: GNAT family N-acetyltransferase [Pseudomonadota bacterium]
MPADLSIEVVDPLHADALLLLAQAAQDARALYPELFPDDAPPPTNDPAVPGSVYLVAYGGGVPVGCGALRPLQPGVAEVRRMYVSHDARRRGVAASILHALEQHALALGYSVLRLETGRRQAPAIALYERCGFRHIAPFGAYAGDPMSVCFEKRLARQRAYQRIA